MAPSSKADKKAAVDAAAWMFNVVTSVGIIIVNKALMATYGFSFGNCFLHLFRLCYLYVLCVYHIYFFWIWRLGVCYWDYIWLLKSIVTFLFLKFGLWSAFSSDSILSLIIFCFKKVPTIFSNFCLFSGVVHVIAWEIITFSSFHPLSKFAHLPFLLKAQF